MSAPGLFGHLSRLEAVCGATELLYLARRQRMGEDELLVEESGEIRALLDALATCGGSGGAVHVEIAWRRVEASRCPICGGLA